MSKILFGIFAHPDDEAFGVAGTLISESENGTVVHVITLTPGDAGANPDNSENLAETRLDEWRRGGEILGVHNLYPLDYRDGQLDNESMLSAKDKILQIVRDNVEQQDEICFMTFDFNGLTGHVDHIVASRAAALAFYTLKREGYNVQKLKLLCLSDKEYPSPNIDWLYMDSGHPDDEIDEIVDATQYNDRIREAIRAHVSQRMDGESHIAQRGDEIGINRFIVLD